MSNQDNRTSAEHFFDSFGNWMTGGSYGIVKWIFSLVKTASTMLLMVFIRKNIGYQITRHMEWFVSSFFSPFFLPFRFFTRPPEIQR